MNKVIVILIAIFFIVILAFSGIVVDKYSSQMLDAGNSEEKIENTLQDNSKDDKDNVTEISGEENKREENENMNVMELTSAQFENEVLKSEKTVLIDFYADWCMPCKMMAPVVEKIASENEDLKVVKINVDNEQDIAIQYGIMSIPTFMVVKNGEVVNRIVGVVDKAELESAIK